MGRNVRIRKKTDTRRTVSVSIWNRPGADFDYWIPLDFDEHGTVQQFADFVDEFQLDL